MPVRTPFKRISWLTILISFNVALLILNSIALWKLYFYEQPQATVWNIITKQPPAPSLIDYKDFVSIMLAGLSLMITVPRYWSSDNRRVGVTGRSGMKRGLQPCVKRRRWRRRWRAT